MATVKGEERVSKAKRIVKGITGMARNNKVEGSSRECFLVHGRRWQRWPGTFRNFEKVPRRKFRWLMNWKWKN